MGKLAPKPKPKISWLRMLFLLAVPASIVLNYMHASPLLVFVTACLGVLPLAGFMGEATEQIAARTGPTLGGLLNATFGNAAELIIAIVALQAGLVDLVKASITGSILGNLLLILGLSIVAGGTQAVRAQVQPHQRRDGRRHARAGRRGPRASRRSSQYSHPEPERAHGRSCTWPKAWRSCCSITYARRCSSPSRPTAASSVASRTRSTGERWGVGQAVAGAGLATVGVAVESEILVHATEAVTADLGLSQIFLGLIIIPIIGNAAEHATAIMVARKGQIDLSLQIALGSSTQIALLVAPLLVFIGLFLGPADEPGVSARSRWRSCSSPRW